MSGHKAAADTLQVCKGLSSKATAQDRSEPKAGFLKLAEDTLGGKSKHCKGRAVDVAQASVPPAAYHAITMKLKDLAGDTPGIAVMNDLRREYGMSNERPFERASCAGAGGQAITAVDRRRMDRRRPAGD